MAKTYVACRPGMLGTIQAAFAGLQVEVDETLVGVDYEFRERELTLDELLEEEVEKAERIDADPKNALTFIVPLVLSNDDFDSYSVPYLAVRVDRSASRFDVIQVIKTVKPTLTGDFPDFEVNVSATMGALQAALKTADIGVHSISQADGLSPLEEA